MSIRKIIRIDERKCNGCGECVTECPEGSLQIVNGKATLVKESFCDGLGACIGQCPEGALEIIEREADEFDEPAVEEHMRRAQLERHVHEHEAGGCPGAALFEFAPEADAEAREGSQPSALSQWPVQLHLVPVHAPYLQGADVLLAADCVAFACANFHGQLLAGRKVLIACPKLDDTEAYEEKLAAILRENEIRSLTVAHMEVPCCYGLVVLAERAIERSGRELSIDEVTVTVRGAIERGGEHALRNGGRAGERSRSQ